MDLLNGPPSEVEPHAVTRTRDVILSNRCNVIELGCVHLTIGRMLETDVFTGTGTGIVSIVLSALRAAHLGETPREGRLFATDLGAHPTQLVYVTLIMMHSVRDANPILQHIFQRKVFHSALGFVPAPCVRLG